MKKPNSKIKKLTQFDKKRMWGEEGPYSETHIKTQSRILGVSVSRVFLVVEAQINPFTFEYVEKNLDLFPVDHPVHDLVKNASYEGENYGYVVQSGQEEFIDQQSLRLVHNYLEKLTDVVIDLHEFVIAEFGLKRVDNHANSNARATKGVEETDKDFDILDKSLGVLFHSILPWKTKYISDKEIKTILTNLQTFSKEKSFDIVDLEYAIEYLRITFSVPAGVDAVKIIEEFVELANKLQPPKHSLAISGYFKKPLLKATERLSSEEISSFLKKL